MLIAIKYSRYNYSPLSLFLTPKMPDHREHRCCCCCLSLQSCPTLCYPVDGSPPGSPIPGILQARTLEWVAISFSNAWKWKVKVKSLSRVRLCATPWTAAHQVPPSMGFSRQEYWSGVPLRTVFRQAKWKRRYMDHSERKRWIQLNWLLRAQ